MNIRKMFASFSAVALLLTSLGVQTAVAGFQDVPEDAWYFNYVEELVSQGVVDEGSYYRPVDSVNRAELAKMIVLAAGFPLDSSGGPTFTDVASGTWFYDYVETCAANGICMGDTDADGNPLGTYRPGDNVNRAEAAKLLVLAFGLPEQMEGETVFDDVDPDVWYGKYISTAYYWSVVSGDDNSTNYRPGDNVNRAEVAKMLVMGQNPVAIEPDEGETPPLPPPAGEDEDDDGILNEDDNCPFDANADQADADGDGVGDVCEEDEVPVVSAAGLTVALGDPIAGGTLPLSATSVKFLNIDFTAGSEGDVELDSVVVKREGVGTSSDFSNVYLYNGGDRLTSGRSISIDDNEAEFNNLNLAIPAGDTVTLTVRADLANGTANNQNSFMITGADKIESNAASVTLSEAISGERFTWGGTQGGVVTILKSGTPPDPTVGEEQAQVAEFQLKASSTEDIELEQIALIVKGSVNADQLTNFTLKDVEGTVLATDEAVNKDDLMSFVLDTPYLIGRGNGRTFQVSADVSGKADAGDIINIYLDENTDLIATGTVFGYGVGVDSDDTTGYDGSTGKLSATTVLGGDVTLTKNGPASSDLPVGGEDELFSKITITSERNIEFQQLVVEVGATYASGSDSSGTDGLVDTSGTAVANYADLRLVKLSDNGESGETLGGPKTFATTATTTSSCTGTATTNDLCQLFTFTEKWTMDAGETIDLGITMDIEDNSEGAITGDQIVVRLNAISTTTGIKDIDSTNMLTSIVPASTITGNTMTVRSATLTLTGSATPASRSVVVNSQKVQTYGAVFTAGASDDVIITGLTVTGYLDENVDGTYGSTAGLETISTARYLNNTVSTVYLYDEDDNLITTQKSVPQSGNVTFSGLNWKILAGQSETLVIKTDILSARQNDDNDAFAFDVTSVTAQNSDGDTVAVTAYPNGRGSAITGSTNVPNVAITVASVGSLTIEGSSDQVKDDNIVAGTQNVLVAKYRAWGTTEAFTIKDLTLKINDLASTGSVKNFYVKYTDKDGTVKTSATKILQDSDTSSASSAWVAHFLDINIYAPESKTNAVDFEVYANTNRIESGTEATTFDKIQVVVDTETATSELEALGDDSNTTVTEASTESLTTSNLTANKLYVYRSVPTVTTNADLIKSTTLPSGEQYVYGFTIKADAAGDIGLYKMAFNVGYNNLDTGASGLGGTWDVYEVDSNGTKIGSTLGTGTLSTNTVTITLSSEVTVGHGGSKHFVLEAPNISLSSSSANFADITVKMIEDTSAPSALAAATAQSGNFIWSDQTNASHSTASADWTNGYKVDSLPTTAISLRTS